MLKPTAAAMTVSGTQGHNQFMKTKQFRQTTQILKRRRPSWQRPDDPGTAAAWMTNGLLATTEAEH